MRAERGARNAETEILKGFGDGMGSKPDIADTLFEKTLACVQAVAALDDEIEKIERKVNKVESEEGSSTFVKVIITIFGSNKCMSWFYV